MIDALIYIGVAVLSIAVLWIIFQNFLGLAAPHGKSFDDSVATGFSVGAVVVFVSIILGLLWSGINYVAPEENRLRLVDYQIYEDSYFRVLHDLKFYPDPLNQTVRLKIRQPLKTAWRDEFNTCRDDSPFGLLRSLIFADVRRPLDDGYISKMIAASKKGEPTPPYIPAVEGGLASHELNTALPTAWDSMVSLDDCLVIDAHNWRCDSIHYGYGANPRSEPLTIIDISLD